MVPTPIIKSLSTGDIHFFHPQVSTQTIAKHLDKYYTNSEVFSKIDIFHINGDLFDKSGSLDSSDTAEVIAWFGRVCSLCEKHNVKLRILHGTKSHDKHQTRILNSLYAIMKSKIDFKYIDTISIEYIEDFNRYVLYVPDDMGAAKQTYVTICELMNKLDIDKIDYACFHGFFNHQIPEMATSEVAHSWGDYENIIKEYIFISHVHTHSVYEKIIAPGSPERLRHGEEENKGAIIAEHNGNKSSYRFIINAQSTKFITIKIKDDEIEELIKYIDQKVLKCVPNDHIKIKIPKNSQKNLIVKTLAERYPLFNWDFDWIKDKPTQRQQISKIRSKIKDVPINETTLPSMIKQSLIDNKLPKARIESVMELLSTYMENHRK